MWILLCTKSVLTTSCNTDMRLTDATNSASCLHSSKTVCSPLSALHTPLIIYSGAVGFVRSYGKYLPEENITLNAICPHVLRTGISTGEFYDNLEAKGLLTPMKTVVDAFESLIDGDASGECLEAGPVGNFTLRAAPAVLNKESQMLNEMLCLRGHPLHEAKQ